MRNRDRDPDNLRLRELVAVHGRAVESLLIRLERDSATREDLWSEVFTTAHLRIDHIAALTPHQQRAWLLQAARNHTSNSARRAITRRRFNKTVVDLGVENEPSSEDRYFDNLDPTDGSADSPLSRAWQQLSVEHQRVLDLAASGLKSNEIASALGISPTAARSRLMRAREKFESVYESIGAVHER